MANYYSYNTNQVQADINMDNAIKDIQNQLLNIPTDTQLGLKANQTDLDTTNANVAANTSSLVDVSTNINDRGINIMHPPVPLVGLKADGTDETTKLQNLINTLLNVGGKIFIPLKTFYVQGISINGNQPITIEGVGTLKLPSGATQNLLNIDVGASHTLKGITIDGNKTNVSATVNGINFLDYTGGSTWQSSATMEYVSVANFTGNNIYAGAYRSGGKMFKCNITSSGYGLRTSDTIAVADWMIDNCQFGDNGYNIYGHFTAALFTGNAIYRSTYTNVTLLSQTWYSWLIGNSIDSSQQVGLAINGDPTKDNMNMIIGNTFFGNSASGDGLYSDITAKDLNLSGIMGNTFYKYPSSNRTKYALELISSNNRVITFANNNLNSANHASGIVSDGSKTYGYNAGQTFTKNTSSISNLVEQILVTGKARANWQMYADGKQWWSDGTAANDTNLYRSAASTLKTDGNLVVGGNVTLTNSASRSEWLCQGTSRQAVSTLTPNANGNFSVKLSYRVANAATNVTFDVTFTDGSGTLQTITLANVTSQTIGSHPIGSIMINATTASAITVNITAGAANNVYVSTSIKPE